MKTLRRIIQWTTAIVCGIYMLLQIAMHIPTVQYWAGDIAENIIQRTLDWHIHIGKVRLGLWNRIIIDDIKLIDRDGIRMLHVSRMAAKVDVMPLFEGKISIANGQLFGAQADLYQKTPDGKPNFQFIIDTFRSEEPSQKPLDLHIGSLLLRHVSIKWNKKWIPRNGTGILDPNHLWVSDIALTAHLHKLTPDSINLDIRRFDFKEQSGLTLKSFQTELEAGTSGMHISDFDMQMPNSRISIPLLEARWRDIPKNGEDPRLWFQSIMWHAESHIVLDTRDIQPLIQLPQSIHKLGGMDLQLEANGSQGNADITHIALSTTDRSLLMHANARVGGISTMDPSADIRIESLEIRPDIAQILPENASGYMARTGQIDADGNIFLSKNRQTARIYLKSAIGRINLDGTLTDRNNIDATISTEGLELDRILATDGTRFPVGKVALKAKVNGRLKDAGGKPDLDVTVDAPLMTLLGYEYHGVHANASYSPTRSQLEAELQDINGNLSTKLQYTSNAMHHLQGTLNIHDLALSHLNLTSKYPNRRISADAEIDLRGNSLIDIAGRLSLSNVLMQTYNRDSTVLGPMYLDVSTTRDKEGRALNIESSDINLHARGQFGLTTLPNTVRHILHRYLPSVISKPAASCSDNMSFDLSVRDTTLIQTLLNTDLQIPHEAHATGLINGPMNLINIKLDIPELRIGKEKIYNTNLLVISEEGLLNSRLTLMRAMKSETLPLSIEAVAGNDRLRVQGSWNNTTAPVHRGSVDVSATFPRGINGQNGLNAWIAPTDIVIADTTWHIKPGTVTYHSGIATVNNLSVSQGAERWLEVNGRISPNPEDSLIINLHRINVEYVMNLINFHDVDFSGDASGTVCMKTLGTNPWVDGILDVSNWKFNNAPLGHMTAHLNWGDTYQHLSIEADMDDTPVKHKTHVDGYIGLTGNKYTNSIDLRVYTQNFNLAFLNKFTTGILDDMQGRVSGFCRIYGPLRKIDLDGDMLINKAHLGLPMLGTDFFLENDSVKMRPGHIAFDVLAIDPHGVADAHTLAAERQVYDIRRSFIDIPHHSAHIDGHLYHNSFKNLRYIFDIQTNNLLAYNTKDFGEDSFYATVYTSGNVNINGRAGRLDVNIDVEPQAGTQFTYNVTTPDALTQANFITYRKQLSDDGTSGTNTQASEHMQDISGDMFLNFNLNMTPAARLRLLMDQKTGSMIDLGGSGHLAANYHNKGRFRLYGTYKVHDGVYNINVQDVINRNFKFQQDGSITFNGDPMQATLNMKAVYTVPNVSLDDLSTTSLGFSKTRVDCIMSLTGRPQQPNIGFDFELPNATDDERQMVRSIVNTEEERNMQAIYLLGLGRFYSYSASAKSVSQGGNAMNSLVSTTISSKINELIASAVGSSKWNFGANLKTGEDGWKNMDIEGLLSGSLFNDRLLLTGNFGYREKYYTQRNFISDVDVQYLLTKSGSVALKAYNQANDRYFVQSALNTQGIGIQFKKDFNRFGDMFHKKSTGTETAVKKVKLTKAEKKAQKAARKKARAEAKKKEAEKAKSQSKPKWNKQTVVRVISLPGN